MTVVPYRRRPAKKASALLGRFSFGWLIAGVVVVGVLLAEFAFPLAGCTIKGNRSMTTGERIYHVPGQKYYTKTRVNWLRGERYFCTEADARASGYRRSKV